MGMAEHESRIALLERDCEDFKSVVSEIRDSLQALVRLEERHNETSRALSRAFDAIAALEKRTGDIEKELPPLIEMRKLIIGGVCMVLVAVGGSILAMVGLSK